MTEVTRSHPLGVSRPDLAIADLPEPEEVFGVSRLGTKELFKYAVGPSLIALGISIGSGEWLLGPQAVGQYGFVGVGWVILVSAILQTFYNVECSRYVLATGESPVVGWGRVPPGFALWVPLSAFIIIFAFIAGGWAASAGQGVYALVHGEVALRRRGAAAVGDRPAPARLRHHRRRPQDQPDPGTRQLGHGRRDPGRAAARRPLRRAVRDLVGRDPRLRHPRRAAAGITATQLGGLAGFTALASGLNWYVMGHYRDKGYGMGYRTGFIAGLRGPKSELLDSGVTFPDNPANAGRWRRWYRLLLMDMWGVFFVGAILGMLLPTILMARAVELSGQRPTQANVPTFVASALGDEYGQAMFVGALILGVLILFSTQLGIFEGMVRVVTDAAHATSPRLRVLIEGDPRRFYYPFMFGLLVVIAIVLHLALPISLVQWSANMSNLGALIYPFMLMYLNSKLPRPARPRWWHYVILVLNFLFFGFFFVNFIADFVGDPLVTF
ncbi:Nramp family divalent metal transporter [Streptosporangium lutulentum]